MKSPKVVESENFYENFPVGKYKINGRHRQYSVFEADFEAAISATGFGKFNMILILIAIPCAWATIFDSTVMSYILPSVYCDLDLNLEQRGMLNAITYLGMITSAFLWGFLSDTLGRKKLLTIGFALDAIFVILAGLSQTYAMLMAAKFTTGFIINGPFVTFTTMLSEFHGKKYRAKILMMLGVFYGLANMVLPLMAWGILPANWHVIFIKGKFELRPWNFYILMSAIPSTISAIAHFFVPESPKFLMTTGRNDEALQVFRKVYSLNSGKSQKSYPIKSLIDETKDNDKSTVTAGGSPIKTFKEGFQQMKSLFLPPNALNLALVCLVQIGFITGGNTLRLWLPQIFTTINDYQTTYPNDDGATLCTMLGSITTDIDINVSECSQNDSKGVVYINVLIINGVNITTYITTGLLINKVGKKPILRTIGGVCGFCIYFARNVATTTALSAINNAFIGVCGNVLLTVVVDLFPTTLRTLAVSVVMMLGRSGAMIGNIVFPILLQLGCWQPFFTVGSLILICTMVTFFLPKTDMKSLE